MGELDVKHISIKPLPPKIRESWGRGEGKSKVLPLPKRKWGSSPLTDEGDVTTCATKKRDILGTSGKRAGCQMTLGKVGKS